MNAISNCKQSSEVWSRKNTEQTISSKMKWPVITFILLCLFTSVQMLCQPRDITFKNYRQFPKRSVLYKLEIHAGKCREYERLYFEWEVSTEKGQILPSIRSDSPFLTLDGYQISNEKIPVFSTILGARVKVSHYSDFSDHIYDIVYFRFRPEILIANIAGGLRRTHLIGRNLVLDGGSVSKDFSYAPEEDAFSGNLVQWTSRPPLEITSPNSLVWEIPSSFFKPGDTYLFTFKMIRTKIQGFEVSDEAIQQVTFLEGIPILNIECVTNCFFPNWQHFTAFKVTCEDNCGDFGFTWYSDPDILDKKNIDFGDGTSKLLIMPRVTKPGETYLFGCKLARADVSVALYYMAPIIRGTCTISPEKGIAGYTRFEIICDNFLSFYGDLTYIVYQGDPKDYKAVLVSYGSNNQISDILLAEGENKITVIVRDTHLMEDFVTIENVQILPFKNSLTGRQDLIKTVKVIVLGNGARSLRSLLAQNNHDRLIQMTSVLLSMINDLDVAITTKRDLMFHMTEALYEVKMGNIMVAKQVMSIMWKLLKAKEETNTHVTYMQSKVMTNVAKALHQYATDPRERFSTITYIKYLAQKLMDLFSELLTRDDELLPLLQNEMPPHEYDSYDEMSSVKIIVRLNFAGLIFNLLETLKYISRAIFPMLMMDQQPVVLDSKALTLSVRRVTPALLDGMNFTSKEDNINHFALSKALVADLVSHYEHVDYEYVHFKVNPFWWHNEAALLNTEYVGFDLYHNDVKIKILNGYNDIFVKVLRSEGPAENVINGTLKKGELTVYRVQTIRKSTLRIAFPGAPKVKILLQHCPPSPREVKKKGKVTGELLYLPQEDEKLVMFLGILNVGNGEVTYNGTVDNYICVTWDQKTRDLVWGGFTFSALKNGTLICRASHLSVFGGMIGVAPNKIEVPVDLDIYLFIHTNFVMLVVLIFVLLLWFFLMIWAIIRDRRLARKNVVFLLPDNVPGDKYGYLVVVVTGLQFDAGTTANVCIQLVGTEAESRPHLIKCDIYEPLQRGYEDWFVIYTPDYLGSVIKLRLWHNCRGRKPHWYCERVIVQELKSGEQFCFIVERWFSLVWGDSEISREIPVTLGDDLKSSKFLFPVTVSRGFRDGHLWLSIFSSPPQSNFTTKERVTVAVALLLLSMLASGMFYGLPKGDASDAIFSQGSYYITTREIFILLESLAVTVPAAVILVLLFKKSGPPPVVVKKKEKKA